MGMGINAPAGISESRPAVARQQVWLGPRFGDRGPLCPLNEGVVDP